MLSFKPDFSLSSLTFIKRLFSSSLLSTLRVVSSAHYLKLLIFLLTILIPACASSSPMFLMMYSAYKLNKQGDNIQPWCTPFPILNQSVVPCSTCIQLSQVRWSGILISLRIFQFVLIHTVKGFGIFSNAEIDVFLKFSCPNYWCQRRWSRPNPWRLIRPSRTNTKQRCSFHHRGLECKNRKSRNT